jgi:antitoxin (DNA-binding transcriptional repressor) of toxin-antitoxin stability system
MTTMTVTIQDMQQRLPELLSQVSNGKTIIIEKNKKPLARLVAIENKSMKRIAGMNRGEIRVSDDFDAALKLFW